MGFPLMVLLATGWAAPLLPVCAVAEVSAEVRDPMVGTVRWTVRLALQGYQALISPANGRSCRFFPSCSVYARQAVHQHGPLLGLVMGLERVQRNHDGWQYSPCRMDGHVLLQDPVRDNDWWFRQAQVGSGETQETP